MHPDYTGGAAFPFAHAFDSSQGMTLRDYFAGQALAGYMARGTMYDAPKVAARVYELADAMIAARDGT